MNAAAVRADGAIYAHEVEPGWVDLERVEIRFLQLTRSFDGYRVVQINHVHADGWMTPERLSEADRRVSAERPDLLVFAGFRYPADDLSDVTAGPGVAPGSWGRRCGRCGPATALCCNGGFFVWLGVEAPHVAWMNDVTEGGRLGVVLDWLLEDRAAILLAHKPDLAERGAESGRFGLQLSGHSHGGR